MSTMYQILVENQSGVHHEFYFFQQPAVYSGGPQVYTNSIGHGGLDSSIKSFNQLKFTALVQYCAGVQTRSAPIIVGQTQIGEVSQVDIDIATGKSSDNDCTTVNYDGNTLSLSDPVNDSAVQKGAFRINTVSFNPEQVKLNIGLSSKNEQGEILLSNFIMAEPAQNTDVQPMVVFYVATGSYTPGTVVNFTTSSANAAVCDATRGKLIFNVIYNADGSWTVN